MNLPWKTEEAITMLAEKSLPCPESLSSLSVYIQPFDIIRQNKITWLRTIVFKASDFQEMHGYVWGIFYEVLDSLKRGWSVCGLYLDLHFGV